MAEEIDVIALERRVTARVSSQHTGEVRFSNRCSGVCIKPMVVYYSLTGKTKLVAQVIAEALNAKSLEIKEPKLGERT